MAIRMDYRVEKLPDTYVTQKIVYKYIPDPNEEQIVGKPTKKIRVDEVVEEKGGWLFTFMRGHQIRCTSEEQIKLLGLSSTQRYIDDSTGLEVNAAGIPVDIADHIQGTPLMDGGAPDTGATLVARQRGKRSNPVEDAIADTE